MLELNANFSRWLELIMWISGSVLHALTTGLRSRTFAHFARLNFNWSHVFQWVMQICRSSIFLFYCSNSLVLCYSCFIGTFLWKFCLAFILSCNNFEWLFLIKISANFVFENLLNTLNARSQLNHIYEFHLIIKVYDTIGTSKVDEDSFPRYFFVYVLSL